MNVQVLYLVSAVLVISFPGLNSSVINCGFEDENLCSYVQDPTLESFTRRSGPSTHRSSGSGPARSVEGQWYMYIVGWMPNRAFARLESLEERPVFKKCLRFSYHMYGNSIWLLKVYMKTSEGLGEGIWMKTRNQGDTWYTATVEVTSFQPFRIVFEAHAGDTNNCEIAIDDVKLVNCSSTACNMSTTDGGCCVLPFTYKGVVYQSCTTFNNNNVPWCSKTTIYVGQWGNCMPSANVPDTGVSLEPWTPWKKCDQTCGSNYRARVRFWYSADLDKSFNFTYHVRYSTSDKLCPEEHRWYFDNLEDGSFGDEYGKHNAVVVSGAMNSDDRMLIVKENQDSVKISFQEGSCIFGGTSCDDGFTLSYWIYLQTQQVSGISSILSSSGKWEQGLKVTMSDLGTVNVTMETKDKKWVINSDITQAKWIYVALTWSECFGLTYYENGDIKEYSGIFDTKVISDYGGLTQNDVNDILFIGKSPFAGGALFSMTELVIWRGQLPPVDIKLLSHKVDGTAKFGFLKPGDESFFEWSKGYASTPSEDTGPSFTHLRNEFDIEQEDYKPSSCNDIKYMRNGISDGYYVIYPRGSCGDALKVYCAGMSGSSPEEYIDVDPDQNYAYYAGLEQPCGSIWTDSGVTNFTKVRFYPNDMKVGITSFKFATIEGKKHIYGNGGACYTGADLTCRHSGHFKINLRETGLRVKPTVKWKGVGYAPTFEIMVNFIRSSDGQEISASCGGLCGWCTVDGALVFEQVSCVKKKPRSCLDVKVYHDITEDGDFIIYPISTGLLPLRVFCVDMATTNPKEYINVTSSDSKNYALYSKDMAAYDTCVLSPTTPLPLTYVNTEGLTRFSKVRLNVDEMYIMNADYHFAELVFGIHHPLGWASSCFSRVACLPRGLFNIDLTGTGIGVRSSVAWLKTGWPYHVPSKLFKVQRGVFGELIDGTCGAYCGRCVPSGRLFVDLVVLHEKKNWRYFGKQNTTLMETTDRGQNDRVFGLSTVCSVAVGCQSGAIPNQAFAASSSNTWSNTFHARLNHATLRGWAPQITDVDPWLSIDLLSVRLVTAIATQGDSGANYVKTYLLSYGFDGLQWLTYSTIFKLPLVFQGNGDASGVIKRDLVKPMFAQYVRFHPLTWSTSPTLRVEIYVCPRASYHHMVTSGDYFFAESSYPRSKGERSELVTRVMLPIYQCMHFWFHMTGTNMGRLDVYVEETGNDKKLTWSVFGDRGKLYWQKAAIPLAINTTFRVYIVGVVGDGYKSDMVVAGLSFTTDGNCSFSPLHASPEVGMSCLHQCVGTTDCDPITGKCICQNKDYVGETCKNELAETLYEDASHYWSFDNAEITDLKTGSLAQGTTERVPGPVNQAVRIKSNIRFRESILVSCLADPSLCSSGLTITLWLKYQNGGRSRFFYTSESNELGIKVAYYESSRWVALNIHGSSHKCSRAILMPVDIWSFVCFAWSISADGTGEIIAYYNGVAQAKKTCLLVSQSFPDNMNKMKADVKSPTSYSMDELVVWNQTLSATKVMQIYHNITRNPDNSLVLTFRLESYRWHRAFGDEESEQWREAREHIARVVSVGDKNTTQVKRIWAEFEVDECIYTGSVINGDASWHESSTLRCDDNRFGVKQDLFHLELTVNSSGARVRLNNIDLGSVGGNLSSTARGGFFASTDPEDTTVLVKDYELKPAGNSSLFTYDDCDMSRSGKFGGQYALFGSQVSTSTYHCMAISRDTLFSGSYRVEAQLYHVSAKMYGAEETGHMGILFNYKDRKNFYYFIVRPFTTNKCYDVTRLENGVAQTLVSDLCPTGSRPTYRTWQTFSLVVRPTFIKAYLSGVLLVHHHNDFHAHAVMVGVLVYVNSNIDIRFKDFVVVKEDHFELLSNFADSRSFSLPSFSNAVRSHAILSMVETTGSPTNVYSVSADFQFAKNDSYSVPGTSTGGFGISFNVIDEQNFDFVYYRRNRIVFADVVQMVADVSWQENKILKEKLESSSLILINKSSTKVPTHIPFNVASVALNSTALNVSWHWDPDNDVTGVFQGFKVLYRQEDDGEESWGERIILGREFERFSPVAVTNLRKGTGYFVKLVAFSLVGDGWPSEEVFNSTHDEVPDIVNLNVTLRNIDLQTVFVQWERLPKHFRNGQLSGYIVTFQELGIAGAQLVKNLTVYGEESNTTLRELKHFTNYSITVMAFNNIGVSLPTNAVLIETIEFVPAISPPNVSATVLNTSALTVSWDPIDKFLWQGLSLGYVVYINPGSKDLYNITVPSNTLQRTITNLTAFTMYNVTVVAYTRKGVGPKSPMIRKRTKEEIPSIPPVNIRVQSNHSSELVNSSSSTNIVATSYSTTIEWDPVPEEKVRGVIRGYKVTYQPVEVYYITRARRALASHSNPVTQNSSTSSIRLDDLLFFTNYSAYVMAYTVGDGIAGSFHFMTPEGAPSESPPNLRASHDGSKSSLSVKWDSIPLHSRNGILKGYHIYYKESSTSDPMVNITLAPDVTQVLLNDLQTFTAYDIHVCGFTIAGDGVRGIITQRTRSYDLAPYTAPWQVSTTLSSPLSVLLTWIPFPESYWHDNPRGYVITFQRVALGGAKISGDPIRRTTVGYTAGSYLWSDLTYYTEYKIEISTITYRGYGPKVILYAGTCNCPSHMTTTFRLIPPYVLKTHGALRGILPDLIRQMTSSCCVPCSTFSTTQIDFENDGQGNMAIKDSHPALVASLNQKTTFAFPIYGYLDQTHYYSRYGFIPGVQSPGMLVILKKKSPGNLALAVLSSIFGIWPILIISVLLASIAGVIMWMLDSYSNEEIFPRTCIRGCLEGFWWAYISMTTVGYGDTTAKSVPARIFAVIWVLLGLCLTSILIGDLCSSLSVTVSVSESTLYGAKVAALVNSTEESVAIRRCAKLVGGPYLTLQQMQEALLDGEVDIVILDVYLAGLTKQLWNHTDLRISKLLNYPSTYGVVFSGDTYGVQHCFRKYIHDNQQRIVELVEKYTKTLSSVKTESATEYVQDLIDVQSPSFHYALLTISFSLAAAFLLGTLWNFACKRRRSARMKKENSVHPVETTKEILRKDLEHFCSRMSQCLETTKRRHGKEIRALKSLKEKSRLRHALNCCRTKVTAAS